MPKCAFIVLLFSNFAFASGGGGYEPPPQKITYRCDNLDFSLALTGAGWESSYGYFSNVQVQTRNIQYTFETNSKMNSNLADIYYQHLKTAPAYLANSEFVLKNTSVSGYTFFRNSNYQIEIYSKSGYQVQVLIFDLENKSSQVYQDIPCKLTFESVAP